MSIIGIETELSVAAIATPDFESNDPQKYERNNEQQEYASVLVRNLGAVIPDEVYASTGVRKVFLSNGMCVYEDVGSHPEITTGESNGPLDATISDWATRRLMAHCQEAMLPMYLQQRRPEYVDRKYYPPKLMLRVSDGRETSGRHLNFLTSRDLEPRMANPASVSPLLLQMLGGIPLFGSGMYLQHARNQFTRFQKGVTLRHYVSDDTLLAKPFVNTRDLPYADKAKYRRLHVVGNDIPFSPWIAWLQLGTYQQCIQLAEAHPDIAQRLVRLLPYSCGAAVQAFANDLQDRKTVSGENGRDYRALDLQRAVFAEVNKAYQAGDIPTSDEGDKVQTEWEAALAMQERGDDILDEQVTWRVRYQLHLDMQEAGKSEKQIEQIDVAMDRLGDPKVEKIIQRPLEAAGWQRLAEVFDTTPEQFNHDVNDRVVTPPAGRAALRGAAIKAYKTKCVVGSYDFWSVNGTKYTVSDPVHPCTEKNASSITL